MLPFALHRCQGDQRAPAVFDARQLGCDFRGALQATSLTKQRHDVEPEFDIAGRLPLQRFGDVQAIVIEQTNPTPRLRKAQALIALGRTVEGDKLLAEIASTKWHNAWEHVGYQAKTLLEQAKQRQ